jgi:hypothetical protein
MCSDTSELVPSTAGAKHKQRYSFLISEWRRALSVTVTRGFASLKLCRIPFLRPTVASAVEAAKLQSNPAPSRFRDCPAWYRVNTRDNVPPLRGVSVWLTYRTSTRFLARCGGSLVFVHLSSCHSWMTGCSNKPKHTKTKAYMAN